MALNARLAFALLAAVAAPAFAADPMKPAPAGAMASDDHMMAADHAMKPMTKAQTAMMAKCNKMTPAVAHKNPKCTKLMESQMSHM